jgi:hypothetical protein
VGLAPAAHRAESAAASSRSAPASAFAVRLAVFRPNTPLNSHLRVSLMRRSPSFDRSTVRTETPIETELEPTITHGTPVKRAPRASMPTTGTVSTAARWIFSARASVSAPPRE